jgi:ubiquinone biosynthesis protein UbiJ
LFFLRHAAINTARLTLPRLPKLAGVSPPGLLCIILNRLLAQNEAAQLLLAQHAGRTFEIKALPIQAKLTIASTGSLSPSAEDVLPQVCLTLDTQALWASGWRPGQPITEQSGVLHVSGDVAMAQTLSTLAKHWRPDLEDLLAQRIGDIAARQLLRGAQGFMSMVWRSSQRVAENLAEYLSHETGAITASVSLNSLTVEQADLTQKLTALDDRVQLIQQRLDRLTQSDPS